MKTKDLKKYLRPLRVLGAGISLNRSNMVVLEYPDGNNYAVHLLSELNQRDEALVLWWAVKSLEALGYKRSVTQWTDGRLDIALEDRGTNELIWNETFSDELVGTLQAYGKGLAAHG